MAPASRPRTGILLLNVGTPDSPRVPDVRRYLAQFLGDGRVIDLPPVPRKLLVNGIIVPFRAPKSAKAYAKLWTEQGSPLMVHGTALRDGLQRLLGEGYRVALAMRYQHPSIAAGLEELRKAGVRELLLVPLYPQYASSSTGSSVEEVFRQLAAWNDIPPVKVLPPFHAEEGYLQAFTERIAACAPATYDHVLFSFHGLPERHIQRSHTPGSGMLQRDLPDVPIDGCPCETADYDAHPTCYKAQCHATARALAARSGLRAGAWSVGFQSRLDQQWIKPFSDQRIEELARNGCRRLLVVSPAFVADCLETVVEIGDEYAELFREHGGQELRLVESLNASPTWVDALAGLCRRV